jgi:hypothetical protein
MTVKNASEELLAAPLPTLIKDLGLAVASANSALSQDQENDIVYAINEAEIEVKIAISVEKKTDVGVDAGVKLNAFSVNASYSNTFGFKEEASSRILIKLSAKPRDQASTT